MKLFETYLPEQNVQRWLFILAVMVMLLAAKNTHADKYLDALQNESDELQYLSEGNKESKNKAKAKIMDIDSFESFLAEEDTALYSIYKKLETAKRLRAHKFYSTTGDYKKTELMIHELHLSHK